MEASIHKKIRNPVFTLDTNRCVKYLNLGFTKKCVKKSNRHVLLQFNVISRYYAAGLPAAWNRPGYFKLRWLINRADPKS
nr:hypothetical protein [Escherichia coli]